MIFIDRCTTAAASELCPLPIQLWKFAGKAGFYFADTIQSPMVTASLPLILSSSSSTSLNIGRLFIIICLPLSVFVSSARNNRHRQQKKSQPESRGDTQKVHKSGQYASNVQSSHRHSPQCNVELLFDHCALIISGMNPVLTGLDSGE